MNALSEWLEVIVHKNGKKYTQSYKQGVPQGDITEIGTTDINGTTVSFKPDETIFETLEFMLPSEIARMKNAAYLTPGVTFTLIDERSNYAQRFCFEGGIKTWLANIVDDQEIVSQPHYINTE